MMTMSDLKKRTGILDKVGTLTLEKVLSTICFLVGIAFLIAALLGLWRHFFTMGLSFAIGIMIADSDGSAENEKRHKDR